MVGIVVVVVVRGVVVVVVVAIVVAVVVVVVVGIVVVVVVRGIVVVVVRGIAVVVGPTPTGVALPVGIGAEIDREFKSAIPLLISGI